MMENFMKDFEWFKNVIRSKGGIWNSDCIRFTRFANGYGATYRPSGYEHTIDDQAITYNTTSGEWKHITPEEYHKKWGEV